MTREFEEFIEKMFGAAPGAFKEQVRADLEKVVAAERQAERLAIADQVESDPRFLAVVREHRERVTAPLRAWARDAAKWARNVPLSARGTHEERLALIFRARELGLLEDKP
jgi:hypothetical protein